MSGAEKISVWTQMIGTVKDGAPEDKIDAYITCRKRLSQDGTDIVPSNTEVFDQVDSLVKVAVGDIASDNVDLAQASLQLLGFCLYNKDIVRHVTAAVANDVWVQLAAQIMSAKDKGCCTRGLWVLSRHNLPREMISKQVETLLIAIEEVLCHKNFQSLTIEFEGLNAIIRLLEMAAPDMEVLATRWGKLVYPLMLHGAPRLRERALGAMELAMPALLKHQDEISKCLLPDLKALLISEMKRLMNTTGENLTNQLHVLRAWIHYVALLGKLLHSGSLINSLLPITEYGFKNPAPMVRCQSYHAWLALIDNFALDPEILRHTKRMKLVMQVFRISHARVENVAIEKQRVWWHFICKLKEHAVLNFDTICIPLIHYSLHGTLSPPTDLNSTNPRVRTPAMQKMMIAQLTPQKRQGLSLRFDNSLASPGPSPISTGPSTPTQYIFRTVQQMGTQILACILGKNVECDNNPKPKFTIEPLEHDMIGSVGFFLKHADILIRSTRDSIQTLGEDMEDGLLYHIWYALIAHMKNSLDTTSRREHVDAFSALVHALRQIVCAQSLGPVKVMKLLQAMMCLPPKALASSAYQVGTEAEIMQHCPLLSILEMLLHHRNLELPSTEERLFSLLEKIISVGMNHSNGVLEFTHGVLVLLGQRASSVENGETLRRMWSIVTMPLLSHIVKTNEVNQGDNLAYDFSCMHEALVFPCQYLLNRHLPPSTMKTLMKSWSDLSNAFSRIAAMVTNAEGNVWCEELCKKILAAIPETTYKNASGIENITHMLMAMENSLDFSAFSNQFQLFGAGSSQFKCVEKKQRYLGNLSSLVTLVEKITTSLTVLDTEAQKNVTAAVLQNIALDVIECHRLLVTHVPMSSMIRGLATELASSLSLLLQGSLNKTTKMYSTLVMQKLERLWIDLLSSLQSRYSGEYDTELLTDMSPLLAAAFMHSRRAIKSHTSMFWMATFARTSTLEYTDNLKSVLSRVKEKNPTITLPGWSETDVVVIEDTPVSQMTQGESQGPLPDIIGLVSPHKSVGSFLNKAVSPNVKNSPLKNCRSPAPSVVPKRNLNLGLDDMNTQDFVVIKTTPKKKMLLTEHQKEVLREKSIVPALYNNLDSTQDQSILDRLSESTQMSQSMPGNVSLPFNLSKKTDFSNFLSKCEEKQPESGSVEMIESDDSAVREVAKEMADLQKKGSRAKSKKITADDNKVTDVKNPDVNKDEPVKRRGRRSVRFSADKDGEDTEQVDNNVGAKKTKSNSELSEIEADESVKGPVKRARRTPAKKDAHSKDNNSQESEGDKSDVVASQDGSVTGDGSVTPVKGCKTRSRSAGSRSPRRPSPPEKDLTAMQSGLQKWLQSTPEKMPVQEEVAIATPILVEETQDVPDKPKPAAVIIERIPTPINVPDSIEESQSVSVKETPVKDTEEAEHSGSRDEAAKTLFQNVVQDDNCVFPKESACSPTQSSFLFEAKIPPSSPTLSECSDSSGRLPMIKLHRLTDVDIATMSPVKKDRLAEVAAKKDFEVAGKKDISMNGCVEDMPPPVFRPKFGRRKSNSIIFSKASQENMNGAIGDLNMDDVIPNSQDSTGFGNLNSPGINGPDIMSNPFKEINSSNKESSLPLMNGSGDSLHVSQNPDIEPMDFTSCDDSQATIITRNSSRKPESSIDSSSSSMTDTMNGPVRRQRRQCRKKKVDSRDSSLDSSYEEDKPPAPFHISPGPTLDDKDIDTNSECSEMSCASFDSPLPANSRNKKNSLKNSIMGEINPTNITVNLDNLQSLSALGITSDAPLTVSSSDSTKGKEDEIVSVEDSCDKGIFPADGEDECIPADENETTPNVMTKSCEKRSNRRASKTKEKIAGKKSSRILNSLFTGNQEAQLEADKVINTDRTDIDSSHGGDVENTAETENTAGEGEKSTLENRVNLSTDSEDNLPLSMLNHSTDSNDDIPLSCFIGKSQPSPGQKQDVSSHVDSTPSINQSKAEIVDMDQSQVDSIGVMTPNFMISSPVSTPGGSKKGKRRSGHTKLERETKKLSIDANFSPSNKRGKRTRLGLADKKSPKNSRKNLRIKRKVAKDKSPEVVLISSCEQDVVDNDLTNVNKEINSEQMVDTQLEGVSVDNVISKDSAVIETTASVTELGDVSVNNNKEPVVSEVTDKRITPDLSPDNDKENTPSADSEDNVAHNDSTSVIDKTKPADQESQNPSADKKKGAVSEVTPRSRASMSRAQLILHRAIMNSKVSPPSRKKMFMSPHRASPREVRVHAVMSTSGSPIKAQIESSDSDMASAVKGSPPPSGFRPIHLPRIYSPSASPSAGILRKRRLSGSSPLDSPSPPYKHRRVSFSDSIHMVEIPGAKRRSRRATASPSPKPVNRCLEMTKKSTPPSPLVTVASKLSTTQSKFLTARAKSSQETSSEKDESAIVTSDSVPAPPGFPQEETRTDSVVDTQRSIQDSAESQLNTEDPICPHLRECSQPVDLILSHLTSSTWLSGLKRLLSSRNITTIGGLCSLSEHDIHSLPIRSPKINNFHEAITKFEDTLKETKMEVVPTATVSSPKASVVLPSAEAELDKLSPVKKVGTMDVSLDDSELVLETSADLLDEIHRLEEEQGNGKDKEQGNGKDKVTTDINANDDSKVTKSDVNEGDVTNDCNVCLEKPHLKTSSEKSTVCVNSVDKDLSKVDRELVKDLKSLRDRMMHSSLASHNIRHLGQMHTYLNDMLGKVFSGLQEKCPSPPPSPTSSQQMSESHE